MNFGNNPQIFVVLFLWHLWMVLIHSSHSQMIIQQQRGLRGCRPSVVVAGVESEAMSSVVVAGAAAA
jgi:hypothetical protein